MLSSEEMGALAVVREVGGRGGSTPAKGASSLRWAPLDDVQAIGDRLHLVQRHLLRFPGLERVFFLSKWQWI